MNATYSPEDNKLRLYTETRLDSDTYARVRAAGFIWAPKQELFVAPAWSPAREDLLLDLCGEIGDEDTSLVERAEQRADRFQDYSASRAEDAASAKATVDSICEGIPLGQPILIGHHSERHARKDAERIENGMRKAVKMWETSEYWKDRAASAIRHAKYLEAPDVRARRIKKLEAEKRQQERAKAEGEKSLRFWRGEMVLSNSQTGEKRKLEITEANRETICRVLGSLNFANVRFLGDDKTTYWDAYNVLQPDSERYKACPSKSVEQCREAAERVYTASNARHDRWIAHYDNRLAYERAMLAEDGGLITDRFALVAGGQVLCGGEWLTIIRVNLSDGKPVSVTTNARYCQVKGVEEIKDYRAPADGDVAKLKAATKLPPLCNYPGKGIVCRSRWSREPVGPVDLVPVTQAQWDDTHADYKSTVIVPETSAVGRHRVRWMIQRGGRYAPVYITDTKEKLPPEPTGEKVVGLGELPRETVTRSPAPTPKPEPQPAAAAFDAMRETLKAGVQVVSAPNLFPTPPEIARRMVEAAGIEPGNSILEPSAGTGNLLNEIVAACGGWKTDGFNGFHVDAVEINPALCKQLRSRFPTIDTACQDFLAGGPPFCPDTATGFDRVIMNPPFDHGSDIAHIKHALTFLKPGGRLVALCANGPRQREELMPLASGWQDLEPGSFKEQGTNVNVAMMVIEK